MYTACRARAVVRASSVCRARAASTSYPSPCVTITALPVIVVPTLASCGWPCVRLPLGWVATGQGGDT
eukprot:6328880-Lingulodinium_polyedra.AAC.1